METQAVSGQSLRDTVSPCPSRQGLSTLPDRTGQGPPGGSYPVQSLPGVHLSDCLSPASLLPGFGVGASAAVGNSWYCLSGHPSPRACFSPAHTVSGSASKLCDSRQVFTMRPPLLLWPPPPAPLWQVRRPRHGVGGCTEVGRVRGPWVSLTQCHSSAQAGQEAAAPQLLQAAFQDCGL